MADTKESAALQFTKPDEIALYAQLDKMADDKDYSVSKLIIRILMNKESFTFVEPKTISAQNPTLKD